MHITSMPIRRVVTQRISRLCDRTGADIVHDDPPHLYTGGVKESVMHTTTPTTFPSSARDHAHHGLGRRLATAAICAASFAGLSALRI